MTPPKSFAALARSAANPAAGGYPYTLKGSDLDENFVFATPDFSASHFTESRTTGVGGFSKRKIEIRNPLPNDGGNGSLVVRSDGKWVASATPGNNGEFLVWRNDAWETSIAPDHNGQFLSWNSTDQSWELTNEPYRDGQMLAWDEINQKWVYTPDATADGQFLVWDTTTKKWEFIPTPSADGQMLVWDAPSKKWTLLAAPTTPGEMLYWNGTEWAKLSPPTGGEHVLKSSGGEPSWVSKADFLKDLQDQIDDTGWRASSGLKDLKDQIDDLKDQLDAMKTAFNSLTVDATCNSDGSLTVTLNGTDM